jgi:hypothetical protein
MTSASNIPSETHSELSPEDFKAYNRVAEKMDEVVSPPSPFSAVSASVKLLSANENSTTFFAKSGKPSIQPAVTTASLQA